MAQPSDPGGASSAESSRPEGAQPGQPSGKQEGVTERNNAAAPGGGDQMNRDRKSAETGDKDQDRDRKSGDQATAKIDSDQKQKVRTYFSQNRPSANRIEKSRVSVSIGVPLPVGIALAPLPPNIIVVAADCPLQYFVWGDDVVLVDSCSREVVDIIPNIG
jgi:hypothetical protein